jgi:hypothetical protein
MMNDMDSSRGKIPQNKTAAPRSGTAVVFYPVAPLRFPASSEASELRREANR